MTKDEFCDKIGHKMWDLPHWGWTSEYHRNEAFNALTRMRAYTGNGFKIAALELRKIISNNNSMASEALTNWMTMKRIVEASK